MVYKSAGYDEKSFAPIALVAETPQVLVANPAAPFNTRRRARRATPRPTLGKLNATRPAAPASRRTLTTAELFKQLSGTDIVHVPYKGGVPAA